MKGLLDSGSTRSIILKKYDNSQTNDPNYTALHMVVSAVPPTQQNSHIYMVKISKNISYTVALLILLLWLEILAICTSFELKL